MQHQVWSGRKWKFLYCGISCGFRCMKTCLLNLNTICCYNPIHGYSHATTQNHYMTTFVFNFNLVLGDTHIHCPPWPNPTLAATNSPLNLEPCHLGTLLCELLLQPRIWIQPCNHPNHPTTFCQHPPSLGHPRHKKRKFESRQLLGIWTQGFRSTCTGLVDCGGWWLSGCHSSVAEDSLCQEPLAQFLVFCSPLVSSEICLSKAWQIAQNVPCTINTACTVSGSVCVIKDVLVSKAVDMIRLW